MERSKNPFCPPNPSSHTYARLPGFHPASPRSYLTNRLVPRGNIGDIGQEFTGLVARALDDTYRRYHH